MELTQEQIDKMVSDAVADAKKGLMTPEDLQKEVDRRVESGIQKGLETQKEKWKKELEEQANLTAEQLAKKQLEEQSSALTQKEKEIAKKANKIEAKDLLSDAGIPKANYEKVIGMLVSEDAEVTKANVQNFIDVFNATKTEIETKVKTELSQIKPPNSGGNESTTKEDFIKMGYAQKLEFKTKYPELYKEYMK